MTMKHVTIICFFCFVLCSLSCQPNEESGGQRYDLSGKVISVDSDSNRVTIAHDEIAGFMQAMTMPFAVQDPSELESVSPGDQVEAILVVSDKRSWLENLVVLQKGDGEEEPLAPIPGEPVLGEIVPDFTLVNQDGEPIHIEQYRGKALVVTFIYTRCPLPEFCPRMTGHFAMLEKALEAEPALYSKTHLLTVSFDHEYDTPEVLRDYASTKIPEHSGSFEHWELATGSKEEILAITKYFGLTYVLEVDNFVHSLRTGVIGPEGRLREVYRGNDWEPNDVFVDLLEFTMQ
jgi:protein SCO1/2